MHEFQRGAIIELGDRDFRSIAYRGNNEVALRVLIVDDDSSFRALVRTLITNGHVKVVGEASDGEEAVRLVEKLTPDIVLMDVSMPKRDGVAAAEEIGERWPMCESSSSPAPTPERLFAASPVATTSERDLPT